MPVFISAAGMADRAWNVEEIVRLLEVEGAEQKDRCMAHCGSVLGCMHGREAECFFGTGLERVSAAGMPPHSFCSMGVKRLSVWVLEGIPERQARSKAMEATLSICQPTWYRNAQQSTGSE